MRLILHILCAMCGYKSIFMRLILHILYAMCGYKKTFLCVSYCTYCMQCVAIKKHFYSSHIAHIVCNVWL